MLCFIVENKSGIYYCCNFGVVKLYEFMAISKSKFKNLSDRFTPVIKFQLTDSHLTKVKAILLC